MANKDPKRIKILVADDEEMILELYDHVLGQYHVTRTSEPETDVFRNELLSNGNTIIKPDKPVYDLTLCRQGEEAVKAVSVAESEGHPFAIAFLDVRMPPGPDGIWTAENIRAICADTQIVIVTGYSDIDPAEIGRRVPPADRLLYIQKPFHPFEMRQFASTMAARWEAERKTLALNRELELKVKERTIELQKAYEELEYQAMHDSLTGLPNRTAVLKDFERELSRIQRTKEPLSIIMADLDYFKRINDTFGHQTGDDVLVETAKRMLVCVRPYDTVGRLGGEEFLIVLPGCDTASGINVAKRICASIRDKDMEIDNKKISITISLGVSTTAPNKTLDQDSMISTADKALYRAKREGRNTIRAA
ncbi:MAG: diguanylate cyclase [Desulfobacterales bacterium]|nr:MAG: diguanylate cyclase [Desulfobacterales bacterium]